MNANQKRILALGLAITDVVASWKLRVYLMQIIQIIILDARLHEPEFLIEDLHCTTQAVVALLLVDALFIVAYKVIVYVKENM